MKYTVTFGLEADSHTEAEEIISTWIVTPGVILFSLVAIPEPLQPATIDQGGLVGTALASAKLASIEAPPAVVPAPGGPTEFPGPAHKEEGT